jgi:hypothetical protein
MAVWNWVQANDPRGATFAAQQFGGLFSTAFLRTRDAVQQTIEFLSSISSNPQPSRVMVHRTTYRSSVRTSSIGW